MMHNWQSDLSYEEAEEQLKQQLLSIRELNAADATSRVTQILDAKYEKADLRQEVDSCTNLKTKHKRILYKLLQSTKPCSMEH